MNSREAIMAALFDLVSSSAPYVTKSRRVKLWGDVPAAERPAIFMEEMEDEYSGGGKTYLPIVIMSVRLIIYTYASQESAATPSSILNPLIDAIDAALAPSPVTLKQTLGGLVSHTYVDGKVSKTAGDLDCDGIALIPVKILATI